jgi:hypothetical protein
MIRFPSLPWDSAIFDFSGTGADHDFGGDEPVTALPGGPGRDGTVVGPPKLNATRRGGSTSRNSPRHLDTVSHAYPVVPTKHRLQRRDAAHPLDGRRTSESDAEGRRCSCGDVGVYSTFCRNRGIK